MTREEAHTKLMAETRNSCTEGAMVDFIDMAVALGMLKLDETKLAPDRVNQMFEGIAMIKPSHLFEKLDAAGFKVVEK